MKQGLGCLAWLTVALVVVLTALVLIIYSVSHSDAAESDLVSLALLGPFFLIAFIGCPLSALFLAVTACRAAQQQHRWGWFVSFLALGVLVEMGVLSFLLATYGAWSVKLSPPTALFLLIGPPLALVTVAFIFRGTLVAKEGGGNTA